MNKTFIQAKRVQVQKKRLLEREIGWIKREFKDFHTVSDIAFFNVEETARLQLGAYWL